MTRRNRYTRKKRKVRKTMSKSRSRGHNARVNRKQHGGRTALVCPGCHRCDMEGWPDDGTTHDACDDCEVDESDYKCNCEECTYSLCEDCYNEKTRVAIAAADALRANG